MEPAESLLEARLTREMDDVLGHTRGHIRSLFGGLGPLAARLADLLALERARTRGTERIRLLLHLGQQDIPAEKLAADRFQDYAETQETFRRARRDHPHYPALEAKMREGFLVTLEIFQRLTRAQGNTYEALVRDAFPRREDAAAWLGREQEIAREMMRMAQTHPGLLRVPPLLRDPFYDVAREGMRYSMERLEAMLDEVYK